METNNEEEFVINDAIVPYPVHPGSILKEELKERGIKQKDFAKQIGMAAPHLSALIHGVRNITAAIAAKLEAGLGIPASLWMGLQSSYNTDKQRLNAVNTSNLVAGYGPREAPLAALADPGPSPFYGATEKVMLTIPSGDKAMLKQLALRLGWSMTEICP